LNNQDFWRFLRKGGTIKRFLIAAGTVAAVVAATAAPAAGVGPTEDCPDDFVLTLDPQNGSGADDNGNGAVCVKVVPGGRELFRDDRGIVFPPL
jgi:hypothetical protein